MLSEPSLSSLSEVLLVSKRRELDRDAERLDREEAELEKIKTALRAVHANLCYLNELE